MVLGATRISLNMEMPSCTAGNLFWPYCHYLFSFVSVVCFYPFVFFSTFQSSSLPEIQQAVSDRDFVARSNNYVSFGDGVDTAAVEVTILPVSFVSFVLVPLPPAPLPLLSIATKCIGDMEGTDILNSFCRQI